jgi:hypothetical protein
MNDVRLLGVKIASRAERRCLVILMYSSFLLLGVAFPASRLLATILALLCLVGYWGIYKVTRRYAPENARGDDIAADEREAAVRDRAMAKSYLVLSSLFVVVTGFMAAAGSDPHGWYATPKQWNYLFVGVLLLTSTLPRAVIAWNEPDAPYGE